MFTPGSRVCAYKMESGRHEWPNRDPMGDWAFLRMQLAGKTRQERESLTRQSRLPNYLFVKNESICHIDYLGLATGTTTWQAPPCGDGATIQYIQVVLGGNTYDSILGAVTFGGFPRVDNGGGSTPYYPNTLPVVSPPGESGAVFGDKPRGFSCNLSFEVCRVCVKDGKIIHIGPCKKWHVSTTDQDLGGDPTLLYPDSTFINVLNGSFPGVMPPLPAPDPAPPAG